MNTQKYILGSLISIILFSGCSNEIMTGNDKGEEVRFTATLENELITKNTLEAPAGTYYLGYITKKDTVSSVMIEQGGTVSATGIYWMNVAQTAGKSSFTLDNVEWDATTGKDKIPADRDILWASDTKAKNQKLDFVLRHKMSQVKVEIKTPDKWNDEIATVSLEKMQNGISFDRKTGIVTASGQNEEVKLPAITNTNYYGLLLPPQNRTDQMALKVVTRNGKTYKRALPFSMDELIENGQWAGTPLKFRSGYVLELTANIKDDLDYTILFTGATLQDWQYIGSSTIPARPSGLYTTGDLQQWIEDYNAVKANTKQSYVLHKYGELSNNTWTFTLRRDIDADTVSGKIENFTDKLTQENDNIYHIENKIQSDLIKLGSGGKVENNVFQISNP